MYEQEEVNNKRVDNALEQSESNNRFRRKVIITISLMAGIVIYAVTH